MKFWNLKVKKVSERVNNICLNEINNNKSMKIIMIKILWESIKINC
jgi:hypothetical protein